jgi:hypothetical protein
MLLREHRFTFFAGAEIHVFRIEELIGGVAYWPQRFRLQLPASSRDEAKTIYGADCETLAQKAAEILQRGPMDGDPRQGQGLRGEGAAEPRVSPWRPGAPPQTLQIQE